MLRNFARYLTCLFFVSLLCGIVYSRGFGLDLEVVDSAYTRLSLAYFLFVYYRFAYFIMKEFPPGTCLFLVVLFLCASAIAYGVASCVGWLMHYWYPTEPIHHPLLIFMCFRVLAGMLVSREHRVCYCASLRVGVNWGVNSGRYHGLLK